MTGFDYEKDFTQINFRELPELYQVGKGDQGEWAIPVHSVMRIIKVDVNMMMKGVFCPVKKTR